MSPTNRSTKTRESDSWFQLVLPLVEDLQDPESMGGRTPTQVIADAASLRGVQSRTLGKQVLAARFLLETYPALLKTERMSGGYSQVEYLAKVYKIDPSRADRIVKQVFADEISMAQMRTLYNEVVASGREPISNAAIVRKRAMEFEKNCLQVIKHNKALFRISVKASVERDHRIVDMRPDFVVIDRGDVIAAFEARIGGLSSAKRDALVLTARLALLTRRVENVYLLVPTGAEELIDAMNQSIRGWGVERLTVVEVEEHPPYKVKLRPAF